MVRAVSTINGDLVAHTIRATADGSDVRLVRLDNLEVVGSTVLDQSMSHGLGVLDAAVVNSRPVVVAAVADHFRTWELGTISIEWNSPLTDESRSGIRAVALGDVSGSPVVASARHEHFNAFVELTELGATGPTPGAEPSYSEIRGEHLEWMDTPLPAPADEPTVDDPTSWPRTTRHDRVLAERSYAVTGSLEGSAVVWETSSTPAMMLAGPFVEADRLPAPEVK